MNQRPLVSRHVLAAQRDELTGRRSIMKSLRCFPKPVLQKLALENLPGATVETVKGIMVDNLREELMSLCKGDPTLLHEWATEHGRVEMECLSVEDLQKVANKLDIRVAGKAKKAYLDAIAPRVGVQAFALKKGLTDWLDSLCLDADH